MNKLKYMTLDYNITAIETWYERPALACCYLLESDGQVALIDTGTAHTAPLIIQLLKEKGIAKEQVKYIIPTHVHLDHAGGSGQLMASLPNATLVVHPYGSRHLIDPSKLQAGATIVYGEEKFKQSFDTLLAIDKERVIEMHDEMELDLNGRILKLIDTPGHARHHQCVWDELSQGLFTGDVYGNGYQELVNKQGERYVYPVTSPVQLDPPAWHQSIDKLVGYNPKRVFLTHYGQLDSPQLKAQQLHDDLDAYIEIAMQEKTNTDDRYQALLDKVTAYHVQQMQQQDYDFNEQQINELIGTDMVLCAQGLEVWLQRQER